MRLPFIVWFTPLHADQMLAKPLIMCSERPLIFHSSPLCLGSDDSAEIAGVKQRSGKWTFRRDQPAGRSGNKKQPSCFPRCAATTETRSRLGCSCSPPKKYNFPKKSSDLELAKRADAAAFHRISADIRHSTGKRCLERSPRSSCSWENHPNVEE